MADEKKENPIEEELEEQEGTEGTGTEGVEGNAGKETGKTFTQEQVTRISTREKNQGRAAAYKELGIDPKDAKVVAAVKAFIGSQKTDEQKAAEKQAEDTRAMEEANQRALVAEARAEALMLGAQSQYVDDLVTLALAKKTDDADLKTIIGEFKTKYPVWFGNAADGDDKGKGKAGQKGTGASMKNYGKEKQDGGKEAGLGARLAAQRKTSTGKASYWGNNKK